MKLYLKYFLESKLEQENPKGEPRELFIIMMLNVRKFCLNSNFDLRKTGATLSTFYLTHIFTTSKFDRSSQKVFSYFKDLLTCHALPFPPDKIKIFTHKEVKSIMEFFYKIYLRNLPLLRLLCLPNFAFSVQYGLNLIEDGPDDLRKSGENKPKKDIKKTNRKAGKKKKK